MRSLFDQIKGNNENMEDIESLTTLAQSLTRFQNKDNKSLFSKIFGVDFSSPNGFSVSIFLTLFTHDKKM